jgi:putative ABC transport system ATP-binding protein
LPTLTVLENVMLPMDFCKVYRRRERKERAMYLLEQVSIADQADKLPSALSGGEQQRAAIARALANDPPLVVADEPTGNLDTVTAAEVFALFEKLVRQGKTLMVVTHDRSLSAQTERVIHLLDGRLHRDENNGNGAERRIETKRLVKSTSDAVNAWFRYASSPALRSYSTGAYPTTGEGFMP